MKKDEFTRKYEESQRPLNEFLRKWGYPERHIRLEKSDLICVDSNIFELLDEWILNFPNNNPESLYLYSKDKGTGKTSLTVYVTRELMKLKKVHRCQFYEVSDLFDKIRNSYSDNSDTTLMKIKMLIEEADLIVFDDIGKEKASDHTIEKLYSFINTRYNSCKPVLFTSNYFISDLKIMKNQSDTAEALLSRLDEMVKQIEVK